MMPDIYGSRFCSHAQAELAELFLLHEEEAREDVVPRLVLHEL
jgi:hypothetical protein